eukprot:3016558-Rhodomonas_salina.1
MSGTDIAYGGTRGAIDDPRRAADAGVHTTLCTHAAHPLHTRCTPFHAHPAYTPCAHPAHALHTLYTLPLYTLHTPSLCTPCTRFFLFLLSSSSPLLLLSSSSPLPLLSSPPPPVILSSPLFSSPLAPLLTCCLPCSALRASLGTGGRHVQPAP